MTTHCKLCGNALDEGGTYCNCGGHFHGDCYDGHREWCPTTGSDRWVGAVEI